MAGIVPEPNESEAPLTNAQQDEEGSNSEDGNLDSHSVTIEEIEIIDDLLEFEALMQIIETASINLLDLFWEFEAFAHSLGINNYMPSEDVLLKGDCLFQEMIEDLIYDIEEFAADVLLDEPFDNSYIELNDLQFPFPEFEP